MKKGAYLVVFLTIYIYVFLATGTEKLQCFHFTWARNSEDSCEEVDENDSKINRFTPCINPLCRDRDKPNLTAIWKRYKKGNKDIICTLNLNDSTDTYLQQLERHSVCVKYTYMYNNEVVNVSYFVGRVTEDQTKPVESGCYVQYTGGYSIEACVCKSEEDKEPCNSTIRNTYSSLIIFITVAVSLFMCKIFDIS